MYWLRTTNNTGREHDLLLFSVVALMVISFAINRPLALLVVGFIASYMVLIRLYDSRLRKKLNLENTKRSIRMFEGEVAEVEMVIKNESFLPIFNGYLTFSTNEKVSSERFVRISKKQKNFYQISLLLKGNAEARIPISFKAKERGVVRLKEFEYTFPHILNFEQVTMKYKGLYQTELLVYPKLIPVAGIEEFPYNNFGNQVTQFSPYEDLLSPVGTRDYTPADPFHRIHWKASARSQTLQTKVYERNRNISWTIIVNIAESSPLGNVYLSKNMEQYLSQAAYICQAITKQGYPIELYVNAARVGSKPYNLESESGREHLKKALELLTRIEKDCNVIPVTNLLHQVDHVIDDSNIVAIIGETYQDSLHYTNKWNRQGNSVFQVNESAKGARLIEVKSVRTDNYDAK